VEKSASASVMKLEEEVFAAEQYAQQQSARLKEKEGEWTAITMESVAKAQEEEKVRLQSLFQLPNNRTISQLIHIPLSSQHRKKRAIAVEKKKAVKQTKKLEQDYNAILNQKNSHIKVSLR
jgi:Tol biopolymer transport system component